MAEGFAQHLGAGKTEAFSAGTQPAQQVNPLAVEVMREIGINISTQKPKRIKETGIAMFDLAVTMGCLSAGQECPLVPAKEVVDWNIPDPKGKPIEVFREVRDRIHAEVSALLKKIE
jgi:protein-tyrosine-phosphatase